MGEGAWLLGNQHENGNVWWGEEEEEAKDEEEEEEEDKYGSGKGGGLEY